MHNIRKIKDLDPKCGKIQTLVLYCTKIEEKTTKSNTPSNYLVFYLTDGETDIDAKRWNYSLEDFNNARVPVKIPGVVILKLEIQEYNGQPSYIIHGFTSSDQYPVSLFAKTAPIDTAQIFDNILNDIKQYREPYASLVGEIFEDHHDKLLLWGGAKRNHHNMAGGLLYHICRMHEMATYVSSLYDCDADLLMAGVDLHDIGKLHELFTDDLGSSDLTDEGYLKGHIVLGIEIINSYVQKLALDPTVDILKLEHMILSHHGKLEWGSPVQPAFLEAVILHHLDVIDSQGETFERAKKDAQPDVSRPFTGSMKGNILFNR